MKSLSDNVVAKLLSDIRQPDLSGTRYQLVRHVARGGMASIWLVEDTVLNRQIAMKVLDLVPTNDDLSARLLQEARILAGLQHPGIVPVYDAGTLADGRLFYCMKYVEGQTLARHITALGLSDKLRLLQRVAEPLEFAHSHGFIHRDLKPENIMIGAFGEVLVMDWGLAKIGAHSLEQEKREDAGGGSIPTVVLGTPGYMSPEQARGAANVDYRTDIYSLGAILRFMTTEAVAREQSERRVPRPLRAICEKAMASDPNARYQSVRDMAADIERYLSNAPVDAYPESLLERALRIGRRHSVAVTLVAVYVFMRLLFIILSRR